MVTITDTALLRLLQLSSAALPVGGYSFSQGLEYAIDSGWLKNAEDISQWLSLQLQQSLANTDLPLLSRQLQAARIADSKAMDYWNCYTLACRETSELRLNDTAMGAAMVRLLNHLDVPMPLCEQREITFVAAFAMAAAHWQIDCRTACQGYLWSWLENQVAAATKLVPLGQTSAQQLLGELLPVIPLAINQSETIADEQIGSSLPAVAMASAWHETQYSRLFRS
ncbi:MAG: urease accessory protein UreF [Porticoccaceae bacterium]|nr:urease accessory protein UreF [Porticoccaceae bacterium]